MTTVESTRSARRLGLLLAFGPLAVLAGAWFVPQLFTLDVVPGTAAAALSILLGGSAVICVVGGWSLAAVQSRSLSLARPRLAAIVIATWGALVGGVVVGASNQLRFLPSHRIQALIIAAGFLVVGLVALLLTFRIQRQRA